MLHLLRRTQRKLKPGPPAPSLDTVVLEYGYTMMSTQTTENALAKLNLVTAHRPGRQGESVAMFKRMRHGYQKASVEQIINLVSTRDLPPGMVEALQDFKDRRNYLAHSFFRESIELIHDAPEPFRAGTMDELRDHQERNRELTGAIAKHCAAVATATWGPQPGLDEGGRHARLLAKLTLQRRLTSEEWAELLPGDAEPGRDDDASQTADG